MPQDSGDIPAPVKRAVRQEARFGCCVCGFPVYEYHHIIERGKGGPDTADNLMLLCPNHHTLATQGGMPEHVQREHKACPYNVSAGYSAGLLAVTQETCVIEAGSGVLLAGEGAWLVVDDEPLLSLRIGDDGRLLLSVTLYSEGDELVAEVVENEWIAGDPQPWDLEANFRRLKLNLAPRDVALRIDARGDPVRVSGRLWRHGVLIEMSAPGLRVGSGGFAELGLVNAEIRIDTATSGIRWSPRPGGGLLISEPDRLQRYIKCVNAWQERRGGHARSVIEHP